MKKLICFITTVLTLSGCTQSTQLSDAQHQEPLITQGEALFVTEAIEPSSLFTLSDAEKILGEPAHLVDSSSRAKGVSPSFMDSMSTLKKDASAYSCGYTANSKDPKTGKTGSVYFLCEHYHEASSAQTVYAYYKTANAKNGIEELHTIGDEAYFHSDKQNFYFIMVRKGNVVFNMKVNKLTSKTSLDGFNLIAQKITDAL